ncbi:MAG: hypothetical protein AB8F65_11680 [Woeseiaceae bacterium]
MKIPHFIEELKRRNVFRVAAAYAIASWVIIQVAETVFPRIGMPDWIVTFVIIAVVIGFPIALIIGWVFELTPDGVHKSNEIEITESVTASTGKKLDRLIIASLAVLIVLLLSERIFFAESTIFESDAVSDQGASIAVLPFVNMSGDQNNEYFSDGLSEELLNGLAKIEGIQVAARTSSFSFKGKNVDLRKIADQLGVKHILEGSVRKDGDQVRITAQLIQADNGFHLWSDTYDRELEGVFAIQEEISRKVIEELKVRLLPKENALLASRSTENVAAYNLFLEATQVESSRKPADLERAIDLYKMAVELDPNFALAHARAAITYTLLSNYGNIEFELMLEQANYHTDQAFILDANLGEAFLAKAQVQSVDPVGFDMQNVERLLRKAIELIPNSAFAHNTLHIALEELGRDEESHKHLLIAHELDPLSNPITNNTAGYYYEKGDYAKAMELVEANIARAPEYSPIYMIKVSILRDPPKSDLVGAFKFSYDLYRDRKEDLQFLRTMELQARDLGLIGFSNFQAQELVRLYPDIFENYKSVFQSNALQGKTGANAEMLGMFRERFGAALVKPLAEPRSWVGLLEGKPQDVLDLIDEAYPSIGLQIDSASPISVPIESQGTYLNLFVDYVTALLGVDRPGDAEAMRKKLCDYLGVDDLADDMSSWEINDLFNARICAALQLDGALVASIDRTLYFSKRARMGWPLYLKTRPIYQLVRTHPDVVQLRSEILADLDMQKAKVVAWLKAEGEWQEEWE